MLLNSSGLTNYFTYLCASQKSNDLNNFSNLGLSSPLIKALTELEITEPTDIQSQAIPMLLESKSDFIGLAQTGTGKTAAFGLPLIDSINPDARHTQALVLAPTRELGQQIGEQLRSFSKYTGKVEIQTVYGGAAITNQLKDLKRKTPHIVIATPGRLIDLVKRKAIKLEAIDFLVLDEADEMLNMGFKEDIDFILQFTPEDTATWLFSATMPPEIKRIVQNYMHEPREVTVNAKSIVNENIKHQYVQIPGREKTNALIRFLLNEPEMRGVVFCRTKRDTQKVADELKNAGYNAEALHGDLSQRQRDTVMKGFKQNRTKVLIATDVAARGIDVNDLTHVIHYALPDDQAFYTHRSGRTARAGKKGISLALITKSDMSKIKQLQKKLGITFDKTLVPDADSILGHSVVKWAEAVHEAPEGKVDAEYIDQANAMLAEYSKEQLIEKLLYRELAGVKVGGATKDLNISDKPKKDNKRSVAKGERREGRRSEKESEKTSKEGYDSQRYFINIGKIDGVSPKELHHFISKETNLRKSDISQIEVLDKHSYFNVNVKYSTKVNALKKFELEGRPIRVNRDADGKQTKKSVSFDKPKGRRNRR